MQLNAGLTENGLLTVAVDDKPVCSTCPGVAEYTIINGSEIETYCLLCFKDALTDLVTSNVKVEFEQIGGKTWTLI